MATTVARLQAVLGADTHAFDRAMDKSHSRFGKVSKAAGAAGLAIAGGLAVGIEKSVKAAMSAEESQGRLEVAFHNSGLSAARYTKQIAAQLAAGRKLGFANSEQRTALGSLIVATHDYTKASRDLSVAQDIARFKHVDLNQAPKMLTMAMAGSQRATKQLGLSVQASTANADKAKLAYRAQKDALDAQYPSMAKMTEAQKKQYYAARDAIDQQYAGAKAAAQFQDKQVTAGKVIDLVSKKLHGQADEYSKTAAGAMAQFRAQLTNLEGSLGKALLPALTKVSEEAAKMTAWLSEHPKLTKVLVIALGVLAGALAAAAFAQALLNLAVLANPYVAAVAAIILIGVVIYKFRDQIMDVIEAVLDFGKAIWEGIINALSSAMSWIKQHWELLGLLAGPLGLAVTMIIKHWDAIKNAFMSAINWVVGFIKRHWDMLALLGGPLAFAIAQIIKHRDQIVGIFAELPGKIASVFLKGWEVVKKAFSAAFAAIQKIAAGVRNEFHTLAGALEKVVGYFRWFLSKAGDILGFFSKLGGKIGSAVGDVSGAVGTAQARRGPGGASGVVGSGSSSGLTPFTNKELHFIQGKWPVTMTSGFRTAAENERVGGAPHSDHLSGRAIDLVPSGGWSRAGTAMMDQIANWASHQSFVRWIGWRGVPGHGPGDHLHLSFKYDKGGWLPPGLSLAYNATGRPERVSPPGGDNVVIPISIGGEHIATVVFDMLRRKARTYEKRNLRGAFGNI